MNAAFQDHPKAQFILGTIYYENKYVRQDIQKAIQFLTLAANHDISDAHYLLGCIFYEGKYIKQDVNKAISHLTLAANLNHPHYTIKSLINVISLKIMYYIYINIFSRLKIKNMQKHK